MLARDSLIIDLMFQPNAALDPEVLLTALGGKDAISERKILDPDQYGPQFEMQVSPSVPFRRRGERRLMIVDDSVAPMRSDPQTEHLIGIDLRPEKERLIAACEALDVRLGRLNALGAWGDAVLVARNARDLRAICLLSWALDPLTDIDGANRARPMNQAEFESKLAVYEKRLEELDERDILANLGTARFERRGELLVVDVLEDDGTWDVRRSLLLEASLAAIEQFSLIPGAPKGGVRREPEPAPESAPAVAPAASVPPLRAVQVGERVVLVFPPDRFDREVAAALGKGDVDAVLVSGDDVSGSLRDAIHERGCDFVAPLEFLSEVFVDGKPLSRPQFEAGAQALADGVRAMAVHCPRFGPATLLDVADHGRFITSNTATPADILPLLRP